LQGQLSEIAIPQAFLLDFDGVIVDSAELKTAAFAEIYAKETTEVLDKIIAYQRYHGGVSRRSKFAHFERAFLHREASEAKLDALCRQFADLVVAKVVAAPLMPGALAFLEAARAVSELYLISGTPASELELILAERRLQHYFQSVHGAPQTKIDAFRSILQNHGYEAKQSLAVGDAITECEAALSLGIPFIGVTPPQHDAGFPPDIVQISQLGELSGRYGLG
jgi:phosphoglycolate phosphatase